MMKRMVGGRERCSSKHGGRCSSSGDDVEWDSGAHAQSHAVVIWRQRFRCGSPSTTHSPSDRPSVRRSVRSPPSSLPPYPTFLFATNSYFPNSSFFFSFFFFLFLLFYLTFRRFFGLFTNGNFKYGENSRRDHRPTCSGNTNANARIKKASESEKLNILNRFRDGTSNPYFVPSYPLSFSLSLSPHCFFSFYLISP